jgi:hypothetical protein
MSTQNLAIVFGPTLFSQFGPASAPGQSNGIADAPYQSKVRVLRIFYTCDYAA